MCVTKLNRIVGVAYALCAWIWYFFFFYIIQSCNVTFISWVHTTELVNYVNGDANASTDGFAPNGEWTLLSTSTFTAKLVEGDGDSFPLVGFILNLQRIPTYYIYNIVLPVGMLMVLSVVAHILPFEAGEKIGLQITILLAFSVMLLIMSDNTPRAGTTTPLVSKSPAFNLSRIFYYDMQMSWHDSGYLPMR